MKNTYETPLNSRYASKEMQYLFSPDFKFKTWRRLWIALAESEMELGLNITQEQIDELKAHAEDINYDVATEREKLVRHDVMSHVYAYGVQCPKAKGIIHLGATSCYVGDNTDIITMTEAMKLIRKKLVNLMDKLSKFALEYKDLPCLGFTHFQPAQPTTLGKRASLWLNDLLLDYEQLEFQISQMKLLGSKGTTGTQASFMDLFEGDTDKVKALDRKIADKMGLRIFIRFLDKLIQEKWTLRCFSLFQTLPSRRQNSQTTSDFFSILKRLRSLLRKIRSVLRRWHTSATR